MKVTRTYILLAIIILLTIIYVVGQILEYEVVSNTARSLVLPFATIFYFLKIKDPSVYFTWFLLIFSASEFLGLLIFTIERDYMFYIGNGLYILGYIFLILEVLSHIRQSADYKTFFTKYGIYVAVLMMFAVYLIFLLAEIMRPQLDNWKYVVSMLYASLILMLLTVSLLSFICNDTKKAFILFLASACIVFSEIVQIAYFYLSRTYTLGLIYSLLLVVAFYLFYKQEFIKPGANSNLNLFRQ